MYLDFVTWGLISPHEASLKQWLEDPTWLTLKIWSHKKKDHVKNINHASVSTAKMALLLEMGLSSFGGAKNKVDMSLDRYLPFSVYDGSEQLDQDTINIYWECVQHELLPPYVRRAFDLNKKLITELKGRKMV